MSVNHQTHIEQFKAIPGFPMYRISTHGRIQSLWSGSWKNLQTKRGKYPSVVLCHAGRQITKRIHCLVAAAFLNKPEGKSCVRHLDGNRQNNCLSNLAWGTYSDNEQDKRNHGTYYDRCTGKLSASDVQTIRTLAQQGHKQTALAARFNVSRPTITRTVNRIIWGHL